MGLERAINIADLRRLALRRLPWLLGDWLDGGSEDEFAIRRNVSQFRRCRLVPRYLEDIAGASTATTLFGRAWSRPFGIAPTGYPGLFWPKGDLALARAAAAADVPFIMSGAATAAIEDVARAAPDHAWYQLYAAKDAGITRDMVARAAAAGMGALVVTVDVPAEPKRERNIRNGFDMPFRLTPKIVLDGLAHPAWTARYFAAGGLPAMDTWARYAPEGADATAVALFSDKQFRATLTWRDLERLRAAWPSKLIVKGILAVDDARRAAAAGADGIIVSNHGGRQGDRLPAPLEVLRPILDAVPDVAVMVDGGIRRGADIVTLLALGARFAFVGRAPLFGLTVAGEAGVARAMDILRDEMLITLRQIGRPTIDRLGPDAILDVDQD